MRGRDRRFLRLQHRLIRSIVDAHDVRCARRPVRERRAQLADVVRAEDVIVVCRVERALGPVRVQPAGRLHVGLLRYRLGHGREVRAAVDLRDRLLRRIRRWRGDHLDLRLLHDCRRFRLELILDLRFELGSAHQSPVFALGEPRRVKLPPERIREVLRRSLLRDANLCAKRGIEFVVVDADRQARLRPVDLGEFVQQRLVRTLRQDLRIALVGDVLEVVVRHAPLHRRVRDFGIVDLQHGAVARPHDAVPVAEPDEPDRD